MAEAQPVRSLGTVSGQVRNSSVTQIQFAEPLTEIAKRLQQWYMCLCVCCQSKATDEKRLSNCKNQLVSIIKGLQWNKQDCPAYPLILFFLLVSVRGYL